jgi:flagellin
LKINSNINAYVAANALSKNQRVMDTAMERLSTGVRINSAADDAAGLAISSKMTSQINGLKQAVRNANDAISLVQVAEGATAGISDMLQRMRELAVQAANGSYTANDRQALDNEFQQLSGEIDRIATDTQCNGKNLLDGTGFASSTATFQVGANDNQTITANLGTLSTNLLGITASSSDYGAHPTTAPTLTQVAVGSAGSDTDGDGDNDLIYSNGNNSSVTVGVYENDGVGNFGNKQVIKSINDSGYYTDIAFGDYDGDGDNDLIYSKGNNSSVTVGVYENDGVGNFGNKQVIKSINGSGIYSSIAFGDYDGDGDNDLIYSNGNNSSVTVGVYENDGVGNFGNRQVVKSISGSGVYTDIAFGDYDGDGDNDLIFSKGNNSSVAVGVYENDGVGNFGNKQVIKSINDSGRHSSIAFGTTPALTQNASLNFNNLSLTEGDRITLAIPGGSQVQGVVGSGGLDALLTSMSSAVAAQNTLFSAATSENGVIALNGLSNGAALPSITVTLEKPGSSNLASSSLGTVADSNNTITAVDKSLLEISDLRSSYGATLNRLEYAVNNLTNTAQNNESSRSGILDTNYAIETTELARTQIIQQAAMAMLVQANQQPNQVLELLKSI